MVSPVPRIPDAPYPRGNRQPLHDAVFSPRLGARLIRLAVTGGLSIAAYTVTALLLWPRAKPEKIRLILTGGGTGGHVYPALAIHGILDRQDMISETLYLGVRDRAEQIIVPRHGLEISYISSAPYAGGSPIASNILLPPPRGQAVIRAASTQFCSSSRRVASISRLSPLWQHSMLPTQPLPYSRARTITALVPCPPSLLRRCR